MYVCFSSVLHISSEAFYFYFGQVLCRCIQYTQFTSPLCVCVCLSAFHFLRGNVGKNKI